MALPPRDPSPPAHHPASTQDRSDDYHESRAKNRKKGIHPGADLTVKGKKISRDQIKVANQILDVADDEHAGQDASVALVMTGIMESSLSVIMNTQGTPYGGVFQADVGGGVFRIDETKRMAFYCLHGGKGFNAKGGLIEGVKHIGTTSDASYKSIGHLLVVNQGNRSNFISFEDGAAWFEGRRSSKGAGYEPGSESEATAIVEEYGGVNGKGGTSYHREAFYFQIGDEENPHQSYWDGMLDLASDVHWRLFVDGRTIYYDDDYTLIKQQPAAIIHRTEPGVIGFSANWDAERAMATEMTLELLCLPFQYRAGQVLKLIDFGPLSTGSTAKPNPLPGRWLIWEINRSSGSFVSTFTLRQPMRPKMEPNTQQVADEEDPNAGTKGGSLKDIDQDMTAIDIIDELVLPIGRKHDCKTSQGLALTHDNVWKANQSHGSTVSGGRSDHQGPPASAWAVDMSNGSSPTPQMDALAKELAHRFKIPWNGSGLITTHAKGYQFQLIYRTYEGGNHFNHVHFGVHMEHAPTQSQIEAAGHAGT